MKALKTLLAAAAFAGLAAPTLAEPFTIFVYETRGDFALRAETTPEAQAYWAEWAAYADRLASDGVMRGGAPLAAPAEAVTVDARGARPGARGQERIGLGGSRSRLRTSPRRKPTQRKALPSAAEAAPKSARPIPPR
ncbi:MAG: hypothetical protein GC206_05850 [Alphaproteobacteria bacterium]|nr:hypothetical protein [Alphaproteobacteria bacterium]